jgi:predicted alpha/beta-fold hydrolase
MDRIVVPTLIITAADDPFVPSEPFHDPALTNNPHIILRLSPHGGHCAFVGPKSAMDDGYWAEGQIVDFVTRESVRPKPDTTGSYA